MWAIAYGSGDGKQRRHADDGTTVVRVLFNMTSSGEPRRVLIKNMKKGGSVSATYIDGDGKEHRLESKEGESELILKIPSKAFYVMDAWGAGAHPDDLKWQHEPLAGDSDALVLVVDVHIKSANQKLAIAHLRNLLTSSRTQRRVGTRKVDVSSFIDLKTQTPDAVSRRKKRQGTPLPPHRRAVERRAPPMRAARRPPSAADAAHPPSSLHSQAAVEARRAPGSGRRARAE